jgi:Tfp pilus assembly protein PilO
MVILAAAAVTAAGVGAYQGGKAAVANVGKRMRRRTMAKERETERQVVQSQREQARKLEETKKENMSIEERVARFKQGVPSEQKKSGLFRNSQSS